MSEPQPTKLQTAFCVLMCTFDDHAGADKKLDKNELKRLLKEQMPLLCEKADTAQMDEMFKTMDMDGSGFMEFDEYMVLMASFACICQFLAEAILGQGDCDRKPTDLEAAFCLIIMAFHEHAGEDHKLNKEELKKLLQTEMPLLCQKGDQTMLNELFKGLDMNKDGLMDFMEFMTLLASFACAVHEAASAMQCEQQCR